MPNTLAHVAVHSLACSPLPRAARLMPWVLLGCVIPDVPWILRRAIDALGVGADAYMLEMYNSVQASLAFSVVLSAAAAAFAPRALAVFALLAANCALHLLVDALEIKPGSGVHLLFPFSTRTFSIGLVWPEHAAVTAVTLLGAGAAALLLIAPRFRPAGDELRFTPGRAGAAAFALAVYIAAPVPLADELYEADYRNARALNEGLVGTPIELDRDALFTRDGQRYVRVFGDAFRLLGDGIPERGVVSVYGRLSAPDTIRASRVHVNAGGVRDAASLVGLALVAAVWLRLGARLGTGLGFFGFRRSPR